MRWWPSRSPWAVARRCSSRAPTVAAARPRPAPPRRAAPAASRPAPPPDTAASSSGCSPDSCDLLGFHCGIVTDGCGGLLDCGTCNSQQACGACGASLTSAVAARARAPTLASTAARPPTIAVESSTAGSARGSAPAAASAGSPTSAAVSCAAGRRARSWAPTAGWSATAAERHRLRHLRTGQALRRRQHPRSQRLRLRLGLARLTGPSAGPYDARSCSGGAAVIDDLPQVDRRYTAAR